jgi:hypothetical protein
VSVGSTLIAYSKHYGSAYTMVDYKTKAHSVYANANFLPSPKLNLFTTLSYHLSTAEYDPVDLGDVAAKLDGDLTNLDYNFEHMHEYSNRDYGIFRIAAGGEYLIAPQVTFTLDGEYADLTDNSGDESVDPYYVYGDESGSWYQVRFGLRFDL